MMFSFPTYFVPRLFSQPRRFFFHKKESFTLLALCLLTACSSKKNHQEDLGSLSSSLKQASSHKNSLPSSKAETYSTLQSREKTFFELLQQGAQNHTQLSIKHVVSLLEKKRFSQAESLVKKALFDDYKNPFLHFMNGLIYQQSTGKKALARQKLCQSAFKIAANASTGQRYHWIYLYFYALDALNKREYNTAKDILLQALLLQPTEPLLFYSMAYGAYGSGDFLLARDAINKAVSLDPNNLSFLRSAVLIYAALGENEEAEALFALYQERKLQDSQHQDVSSAGSKKSSHYQEQQDLLEKDFSQLRHWMNRGKLQPGFWQQASNPGDVSGESDSDLSQFLQGAISEGKDEEELPTSSAIPLLFEVIILKAAESRSYMSGVNIISRLNGVFNLTNNVERKLEGINGFAKGFNLTNNLTRQFGISELSYTLNILNQSNSTIWISSNSIVQAMVGKQSFFVVGEQYTGSSGSGITGGTMSTVDIGSKIELTPRFITKEGVVLVDFSITTSTLDRATPNVQDSISSQVIPVTGSNIQTTVKVRLGETIVLASLVSETKSRNYSGIPYLMRIFPLSLFTSQQLQSSEKRYMVFLIKPKLMNKDESFDQWCQEERSLSTMPGAIRQRLLDSGVLEEKPSCLPCLRSSRGTASVSLNKNQKPFSSSYCALKSALRQEENLRKKHDYIPPSSRFSFCTSTPEKAKNIEGLSPCKMTKETFGVMKELGFHNDEGF